MFRAKELRNVWSTIRTINQTIESHNRTIADILESIEKLSSLTAKLAEQVTSSQAG